MVKRTSIVSCLLLGALMNGLQCQYKPPLKVTPDDLVAHVNSFASECSKRGIKVDISPASLQIGFGRINAKSASCKPNSNPKVITLDSMIWKALTPAVKEMLVYHELAHCLIQREHNNDVLPSGECKSWMRENDSWCKINSSNTKWRQYYIEELFSAEKIKQPEWYDFPQVSGLKQRDVTQGKILITESSSLLFDSSFFARVDDWKIEVLLAEPKKFQGYFIIKINEYFIQLVGLTNFADTSKSTFIKTVILDQFKFRQDKNILNTDTVSSPEMKFQLSIRKSKQTVHVFFDNNLRASIPFENLLTLNGNFYFERKPEYLISVHALESDRKKETEP